MFCSAGTSKGFKCLFLLWCLRIQLNYTFYEFSVEKEMIYPLPNSVSNFRHILEIKNTENFSEYISRDKEDSDTHKDSEFLFSHQRCTCTTCFLTTLHILDHWLTRMQNMQNIILSLTSSPYISLCFTTDSNMLQISQSPIKL